MIYAMVVFASESDYEHLVRGRSVNITRITASDEGYRLCVVAFVFDFRNSVILVRDDIFS